MLRAAKRDNFPMTPQVLPRMPRARLWILSAFSGGIYYVFRNLETNNTPWLVVVRSAILRYHQVSVPRLLQARGAFKLVKLRRTKFICTSILRAPQATSENPKPTNAESSGQTPDLSKLFVTVLLWEIAGSRRLAGALGPLLFR